MLQNIVHLIIYPTVLKVREPVHTGLNIPSSLTLFTYIVEDNNGH